MDKKIKLITIDGDGCAFAYKTPGNFFESSWNALGYAYNLQEKWDERIKKYYKYNSSFENDQKWAEEDVFDLTGKSYSTAEKVLYPIPYSLGFEEFIKNSRGKFIRGLLTTSFDVVAKKIEKELNLDFVYCNLLHRENGNFKGTLDYLVPTWGKHEKIQEICRLFKICPKEICHIGDNENDLSVGQSRYEFGVFVQDKLHQIFRTDVGDAIQIIEREARKYIEQQEQENPTTKYQLKRLQWVDC